MIETFICVQKCQPTDKQTNTVQLREYSQRINQNWVDTSKKILLEKERKKERKKFYQRFEHFTSEIRRRLFYK